MGANRPAFARDGDSRLTPERKGRTEGVQCLIWWEAWHPPSLAAPHMSTPKTALTERMGVHEVGTIFTKRLGWYFREQSVSDFGVDAEVEIADSQGKPTGQLIALQIKTGKSFFKNKNADGFTYYGEPRHLEYWLQHSLPVFLILHDPEAGITLWQRVERHLVRETEKGWSITVPETNHLNENSKHFLASGIGQDRESIKRYRFAADKEDMRRYRGRTVFFRLDFWVNKTLSFRGVEVFFDNHEKDKSDEQIGVWATTGCPHEVMNHFFPWLKYEYVEFIHSDDQASEIESHIFEVELNEAAISFLALEEFYADPHDPAPPEIPTDEDAEHEVDPDFDEWAFRRAVERDQS